MSGIGISGMGRIGRLLVRIMMSDRNLSQQLKAINSTHPVETIAHLLKYDTLHGIWNADIKYDEQTITINGHQIAFVMERDPSQLAWNKLGVEIAIDATGKFTDRAGAGLHLTAGASKVIVTAPGKGLDLTVVMGVNHEMYDDDKHRLLSAASCTTNCVAPILKVLDDAFKVKSGWVTTVHAYTNDQQHLDNPHKDLRRARACGQSIIPTKTGVGKALVEVLPHLAPVVQGMALRVPVPDVSAVDLVAQLSREVTVEEVKEAFKQAMAGAYAGVVAINEEPLVSSDYIGNSHSVIVDGLSLMAAGEQLKLLAWYDNEWGYACRVIDLARHVVASHALKGGELCDAVGNR
ncbi:type I glyceraldehyde-3-phosphate dehydrogenase [Paenibacillus albiflavus]|uniref:Type I glyceraldehyde-3-phosphate dehydrogenase n=1 Tax=Paenibacillus albiflavus TaxID=2545760 RepID=A0A4R4EHU0_9BACL|nr:type I glyceraldehyde-3-phosphate dehydrogenase [Paenibacillus albiflavus]TCZ77745.1 type I glyceraldehyde-3-phosphate dehydrogenase [Paenibacillus albiflavus]